MKKVVKILLIIVGIVLLVVMVFIVFDIVQAKRYAKFNVGEGQALYRCFDIQGNHIFTIRPTGGESVGFETKETYYDQGGKKIITIFEIDYPALELNGEKTSCIMTTFDAQGIATPVECGRFLSSCEDVPIYRNFSSLNAENNFWLRLLMRLKFVDIKNN